MLTILHQFADELGSVAPHARRAEDDWGFAETPTWHQLQQQHNMHSHDHSPTRQTPTRYITQLETDHAFRSNHCVAAMADQLGIAQFTSGLSGTLLAQQLPDAAASDSAVQSLKHHIDAAWSKEAVWRGVGYAKAGDYQQAMECYDKALKLNPTNCDAYVARGAAYANQKHFQAAIDDFTEALTLDPANANAAKYLQATEQHARTAAAEAAAAVAAAAAEPDSGKERRHRQQLDSEQRQQCEKWQQQEQKTAVWQGESHQRRQQQEQHGSHRRDKQQQEQKHGRDGEQYHSHGRKRLSRRRSSSSDSSSSSSSSDSATTSGSDSEEFEEGAPSKVLKRPTVSDIQAAIQALRSEKKKRHHTDKQRKHSSKKKHKHRKHGKQHKAKHKHKKRH